MNPPVRKRAAAYAHIFGQLRRNRRGQWVLADILILSDERPTMLDGMRWCTFQDATPVPGRTFAEAKRVATPIVARLRAMFM